MEMDDDTIRVTAEMVDRIMAEDDANDPTLEYYQSITRKANEASGEPEATATGGECDA